MSTSHGETVIQKPISEYAKYMKNLIPANIPEAYTLKHMFKNVASEENVRNGVIAFRDFLYIFCDRLISDGHLYVKPQKTKSPNNYPFLQNVNRLLIDIGYYGKLDESGSSLLVTEIPAFTNSKSKIPVSMQMECLRFLTLCGFAFTGIDLEEKTFSISGEFLTVSYPNAPVLLTGLKTLSIASKELWVRFYNNADNLFRCDYRVIKEEDTDVLEALENFLHPLPEKIQKFALGLHKRYTDRGMTCVTIESDVQFAYSHIRDSKRALSLRDIYQKRVWGFSVSMEYGYCLVVRAKKTAKYANDIKNFPLFLQEKIKKGYGCDRKLRNERCQGGCQGIRIPLDGSIVDISRYIEVWLDNEMPVMCQ